MKRKRAHRDILTFDRHFLPRSIEGCIVSCVGFFILFVPLQVLEPFFEHPHPKHEQQRCEGGVDREGRYIWDQLEKGCLESGRVGVNLQRAL